MKKFVILAVVLLFLFPSIAPAVKITLEDGTEVNTEGLAEHEKDEFLKYLEKINEAKKRQIAQEAASSTTAAVLEAAKDPAKINEWRKLITGTIKDICNDLNVSVNEFVKTPVGLGVAALIFYKVAGKDLMKTVLHITLIVPFFLMVLTICLFLVWRFLGHTTEFTTVEGVKLLSIVDKDVYQSIKDHVKDQKDQVFTFKIPVRMCRYKWSSSDARTAFACFMVGIPIASAIASLIVVLV
jgi:hypothetical protein